MSTAVDRLVFMVKIGTCCCYCWISNIVDDSHGVVLSTLIDGQS